MENKFISNHYNSNDWYLPVSVPASENSRNRRKIDFRRTSDEICIISQPNVIEPINTPNDQIKLKQI